MTSEAERLRRARLGSALRENLKRRKAQARARSDAEPSTQGPAKEPESEAPPGPDNPLEDDATTDDQQGG
jgi:hypothetical protein